MHKRLKLGRALGRWLVPEGFRDAERKLRAARKARAVVAEHRDRLAGNEPLRNAHAGKRAFVLGNGPSLARQDLAPLAGEVTLVANAFWKHDIVERWTPTYYCLADPDLFDGADANRLFFGQLRARCPGSTYLVPAQAHRVVAEQQLLPQAQVRYVAFSGHLRDGLAGWPDLTRALPSVINVPLMAIMTAMYAGCSPIYLLGLDHDWLAHRGQLQHFYAGTTLGDHPAEALADLSRTRYRTLMEGQLDLWKSYEALRAVAAERGTLILNATDGGFLDVFDRARYEDVVGAGARAAR